MKEFQQVSLGVTSRPLPPKFMAALERATRLQDAMFAEALGTATAEQLELLADFYEKRNPTMPVEEG